jgi:predicted DNA-binding protein YlxM (UPF0122 family)
MFKNLLAKEGIELSDKQLAIVLEIATDDIKFNRIGFNKRTGRQQVLDIICSCTRVFKKI